MLHLPKFLYDVDIIGDISNETKQLIINKLRNCPVRKTLSKEIDFEIMQKI